MAPKAQVRRRPAAAGRASAVAASVSSPTGPRALDRSSALPLWAQVDRDIRRRLDEGEFDEAFPGELAFVETYGVSRQTVREALRRLRADGVVTAERGRASRLAQTPDIRQSPGAVYSLFASVEEQGLEQRSVVRAVDLRTDRSVARRLGLAARTRLFYVERLRLAAGEPLALDRSWLPAAIAAPLLDADFSHTALYGELARRVGLHLDGGAEHIRAVVPTPEQQELLQLGDGVAAFCIDRVGRSRGKDVEWRETLVRADRFSVTAQFSARRGYHVDITPALSAPSLSREDLAHP